MQRQFIKDGTWRRRKANWHTDADQSHIDKYDRVIDPRFFDSGDAVYQIGQWMKICLK